MQSIWAKEALTAQGWQSDVRIDIDDGVIQAVTANTKPSGTTTGILLPAPANVHSHAFQRAMAGMTEHRGKNPADNFWAWRKLMYRFLDHLTPDDIEAITAFVQMEMLEAGYGTSVEFHYLHHQADGTPYDNIAELAERIMAAAQISGMGLTLLPVLYEQGGCDGRALGAGQVRFGNTLGTFSDLVLDVQKGLSRLPKDTRIGVAPHSLRAVSRESLEAVTSLVPHGPVHIHLAEQVGEVEEVLQSYGQRPTEWLYDHHAVDARWCLIHATQMQPHETLMMASSGAVAGLCPVTEANLGDGIFDGARYIKDGGNFGIGSDSNIRISLSEELRALEYSQRLQHLGRAVLATETQSTGRVLFEGAAKGGALAAGRNSGTIKAGKLADLMALNADHIDLLGKQEDMILDSYIFAGDDRMVTAVWSAGRHMVSGGRHKNRDVILARYRAAVLSLSGKINA
ncbi:MAG: formimidoylglutamate deiminase [Alphaproteobacteria bacterium]